VVSTALEAAIAISGILIKFSWITFRGLYPHTMNHDQEVIVTYQTCGTIHLFTKLWNGKYYRQ